MSQESEQVERRVVADGSSVVLDVELRRLRLIEAAARTFVAASDGFSSWDTLDAEAELRNALSEPSR